MSEALRIPAVMTVAEFLSWNAPAGIRWQLVDGEPSAMAPASRTHGTMQAEIGRLIGNHLANNRPGCRVVAAPGIVPRMRAADNFRIPDLAVTCSPYRDEEYDVAEPVLIVEILSPSNRAETWANVWALATVPSVREILVIDSTAVRADLLRRGDDGSWPAKAERIEDGAVALACIGVSAPLAAFYAGTRLAPG